MASSGMLDEFLEDIDLSADSIQTCRKCAPTAEQIKKMVVRIRSSAVSRAGSDERANYLRGEICRILSSTGKYSDRIPQLCKDALERDTKFLIDRERDGCEFVSLEHPAETALRRATGSESSGLVATRCRQCGNVQIE